MAVLDDVEEDEDELETVGNEEGIGEDDEEELAIEVEMETALLEEELLVPVGSIWPVSEYDSEIPYPLEEAELLQNPNPE